MPFLRGPAALSVCAGQSPLVSLERWGPCEYGMIGLNPNDWDLLKPSPVRDQVSLTGGKRPFSPC